MGKTATPVIHRSLFSWIWPGNVKLQITIVVVISVTVFTRVLPLEMQKRIINEAIRLKNLDLLYLYCGIYVASVVLASGLKFLVNILQTLISERVLAKMRKDLYHHILPLPLNFFRKTPPGMVVNSLVTELVSSGNFAGMAVAVPVINVLTLVSFAVYLIWLDPILGLISLAIYPIVLFLVPQLQKGANKANRKRVDTTRSISNRITETITGVHEVHGNGSFQIENRKFDRLVDKLFKVRIVWSLYQQGVKVTNNFFTNVSPFLVFLIGGYLAMKGRLELGALVAFLSAQERLYDPWKELIDFYQLYQDAKVRYKRTMEYFDTLPDYELAPEGRAPYDLQNNLEVKDLSFVTNDGIRLVDEINFSLKPGETMALVGFSGSGKSTLAQCLGQLYKHTGGQVLIGDKEIGELTKSDVVHNIGFVAQSPFIFNGTIEDNLLYACVALQDDGENGNGRPLPSLDEIIEVLQQTGVFVDVLRFGLNTIISTGKYPDLVKVLIRIRENFKEYYGERLADYVEFFDDNKYLYFSDVTDNLIFGTANLEEFSDTKLPQNEFFLKFLDEADLTRPLLALGAELSRQTVDILGNLPPDDVFFEQSPINPDELDDFKLLVERLNKQRMHQLPDQDREKLLELALRFTPGRHKMTALPKMLEQLILEGRALFRDMITDSHPEAINLFEMSSYIYSETFLNNIFFGKTKTTRPEAQEKINQSIIQLLIEEDLLEAVVKIGMQFQVGTKGDKLSGGQRQKLAIARTFLKNPKILIMDEATSALDNKSQARIQNQLEHRWKGKSTLIAVVHRLDITKNFDRIAVMKAGNIVEMGKYDELLDRKGMLHELVVGKK